MKTVISFLTMVFFAATGISALAADRTETVKFPGGASGTTISGSVKGYDGVDYLLGANAGQMMHVLFSPSNRACYFNVNEPGNDYAIFNGSASGNEFSARLTKNGNYMAQVYLMRSAARRGETCKYSISFEISGGSASSGSNSAAASPRTMMAQCRERAHQILRTRLPNIETKYEGQRTDGTHAVNGSAFIHGRQETFQCSFNRNGGKIVQFVINHHENSQVGGSGANFDATGQINCALYEGQPYELCRFGVVRKGNGTATLTVFFANGTRRVINFNSGTAVSSNSDAGVYADRHADLMTVYVGTDERYEIPDAAIYGG